MAAITNTATVVIHAMRPTDTTTSWRIDSTTSRAGGESDPGSPSHPMDEQQTPDAVIARLALANHGVVDRAALSAAGLSRGEVDGRIRRGQLFVVHRGVYAVGHTALSREGRWMAAVLACGDGAVLSHRRAAVCGCCADREDLVPHVTAPHRLRPAGVVAHRGRLAPADMTVRNGIPVTSPARTLVDLAQSLSDEDLERVVRQAQ